MNRILAISDIHGCGKTFIKLLQQVGFNKNDTLVIIGDLIDRGPNTKLLIDEIMKLQEEGFNIVCTIGNHEELMFRGAGSIRAEDNWRLNNGGIETLESFGVECYNDLDEKYKSFFMHLLLKAEIDKYIFVHAGINNIHFKDPYLPSVVLWTRNWYEFLDKDWLGDRYIIHGHVPQYYEDIINQFEHFETNRYLNIDAGCCYTSVYPLHRKNEPERLVKLQKLCLVDLTNRKFYFEENCEN